jgi:ubiquinone/menaquinone biosynthesis C-methylase UbiE
MTQPSRAEQRNVVTKYQAAAPGYDGRAVWLNRVRRRAVDRLRLRPGDTVVDVGCGTGISFDLLAEGIGPEGQLIGIDVSPDMLDGARRRVASRGWSNVALVNGSLAEVTLPGTPNAVLFHFTHDVLRSVPALDHLFRQVAPGARVAAAGFKWVSWWLTPVNAGIYALVRPYVTTFEGFRRPFSHLPRYLECMRVDELLGSSVYIADGVVRPWAAAGSP